MASAKITDVRKNEVVAHAIVDDYPKDVSAVVGIHALGQLAEMVPHEEFVSFVEGALKHATTGQAPQAEQQQPTAEPPAGSAAAGATQDKPKPRPGSSLVKIEPFSGVERVQIAWVGGKETGNQPKSCFNCPFYYINQKRCQIHGPDIIIDRAMKDGQQYTPVCVYQIGGTPRAVEDDQVIYNVTILGPKEAELTGLEWAKGPGTNCGGFAGGAPCIHFISPDGIDGICDLMKKDDNKVDWDDCSNGHEGEHIEWQEAQKILKAGSHGKDGDAS